MKNQTMPEQGLPKGIKFLSGTEMWERFSYYGIMSILILYLSKSLGLSDDRSGIIVGTYIAFTWMSPVLGGWLADNFLGQVNAIRVGGIGIFLGNLILALGIGGLNGFFVGLSVIILGTGLLKSSISIIIGQMFDDGDPRIDRAYTIFYMFINIGATMSAAISQIAESTGDWRLGFALSTVGMLLGLFIFYLGRRYYRMYPRVQSKPALTRTTFGISNRLLIAVGLLVAVPVLLLFFLQPQVTNMFMLLVSIVVIAKIVWHWTQYKPRREKLGIIAILIYVVFQIFYFSLYQQVNDSIILFMDRVVDLTILGFTISSGTASLLFNSVFIIIMAPLLAALYAWLGQRNREPSTPVKFFLSISVMAVCFLIFALEARSSAASGAMASVWVTIVGFIVFSISEVLS
ncbi:MAG: oligopeptide:H+ symporter, partial [Negativicutes bacterium]|nr:oligopeptide:H+ symporter [Negativicutes bacterium]